MDTCFPRCNRILRRDDFTRAMKTGRKAHTWNLILFAAENGSGEPRLGLAVSRKVGNAAVRHRWKRLIREVFRTRLKNLLPDMDVVVAVKAAGSPGRRRAQGLGGRRAGTVNREPGKQRRASGFPDVERELLEGLRKLGLVDRDGG